jgi:hypothetical protein
MVNEPVMKLQCRTLKFMPICYRHLPKERAILYKCNKKKATAHSYPVDSIVYGLASNRGDGN